jgi:hypothetical protein
MYSTKIHILRIVANLSSFYDEYTKKEKIHYIKTPKNFLHYKLNYNANIRRI